MPLLRRRPRLPADVRRRLEVPRGDRVVAVARLSDGWAVATRQALHVARDDRTLRRRPWAEVDRASLDPATATLSVTWVEGSVERLHLASDRSQPFPVVLRERVQSSVVHSETVALRGGRQVRVAVRRGEDGRLLSQVIGDGRVDLSDPADAAAVDAAEARVREATGLPR